MGWSSLFSSTSSLLLLSVDEYMDDSSESVSSSLNSSDSAVGNTRGGRGGGSRAGKSGCFGMVGGGAVET